jgi:hypothetical protein
MALAIIIALILWLISLVQNSGFKFPGSNKRKNGVVLTPEIRHLENELLGLLRQDTPTAKRLIKQQHRLNPKRSYQWCLEKVIWDLERDRHR